MDYLCMCCFNINLVGMVLFVSTGAVILVTTINNAISKMCVYEENRKQIILNKWMYVLFFIGLLIAMFVPSNLDISLMKQYRNELYDTKGELKHEQAKFNTLMDYVKEKGLKDDCINYLERQIADKSY